MYNTHETSHTTENQPLNLMALCEQIIKRNESNQSGNLKPIKTRSSCSTITLSAIKFPLESFLVSSLREGNRETSELCDLVNKISHYYGGDDKEFLTLYINDILTKISTEKALACFRDLAKQIKYLPKQAK